MRWGDGNGSSVGCVPGEKVVSNESVRCRFFSARPTAARAGETSDERRRAWGVGGVGGVRSSPRGVAHQGLARAVGRLPPESVLRARRDGLRRVHVRPARRLGGVGVAVRAVEREEERERARGEAPTRGGVSRRGAARTRRDHGGARDRGGARARGRCAARKGNQRSGDARRERDGVNDARRFAQREPALADDERTIRMLKGSTVHIRPRRRDERGKYPTV